MKFSTSIAATGLSILSVVNAATSPHFYLRAVSSHAAYNNVIFGSGGTENGILTAALQPSQTLPVDGIITDGVLSFKGADGSDDQLPAYFIHGAARTVIQLNVFGTPQAGYSLSSTGILTVSGGGKFYACTSTSGAIRVFYNSATGAVPSGCYAIQLKATYCSTTGDSCDCLSNCL